MYLICFVTQSRNDFVASEAGVSPPLSAQEECLGLAVLDLWRMAKERHQSVRDLCKTVRYFDLVPLPLLFCSKGKKSNIVGYGFAIDYK